MIKENDSILVFEYFTASGEKDKSIISEAEALLFALLDDLSGFNVDLVIDKSYLGNIEPDDNLNLIFINENIIKWLEKNAFRFQKAIFIAGENSNNLYRITKILEDNGVKLYTSSSDACFKSSDKFETYTELLNIVPQPRSLKCKIDSQGKWRDEINKNFKDCHVIVKPLIGVDCEDVRVVNKIEELQLPEGSNIIVQEFIDGTDISVSLISDGKKALPLSLNKQFVDIKNENQTYLGGKLPFESEYKDEIFEIAKKAVESINGLKGFIGVDLIICDEEIYLLEINSRFTTPYAGLKKIININISESIISLIDGKCSIDDLNIVLDGEVEFKKSDNQLKIRSL